MCGFNFLHIYSKWLCWYLLLQQREYGLCGSSNGILSWFRRTGATCLPVGPKGGNTCQGRLESIRFYLHFICSSMEPPLRWIVVICHVPALYHGTTKGAYMELYLTFSMSQVLSGMDWVTLDCYVKPLLLKLIRSFTFPFIYSVSSICSRCFSIFKLNQVDDGERERLASNRRDLDRFLGPYPFDTFSKWTALSDRVTNDLVKRVEPPSGFIFSVGWIKHDDLHSDRFGMNVRL